METRRAEAFSDGVFAVAITVLVFDLLPIGAGVGGGLGHVLLKEWPKYAAYVVSFLTIGIVWLNHHTLMAHLRRVSRMLLVLNLVLMMCVVAVPFPTALIAEHLTEHTGGGIAAAVTYGLVMVAMSVAFSAMWLYLGLHAGEVAREPDFQPSLRTTIRFSGGLVAYVVATLVAIVSPGAAVAMYGAIAVYYLFEHLPAPTAGPEAAGRDSRSGSDQCRSDP